MRQKDCTGGEILSTLNHVRAFGRGLLMGANGASQQRSKPKEMPAFIVPKIADVPFERITAWIDYSN
jgi:hypothetical protein